ncbi:hypothetical protein GUJ93_ZPchr0007g3551 [Zizania palustris]|uniref:DUF7866 domain-containing protein n=1 Tax=Zizania palustris TaxID=103762 RepID=A0A8J5W4L4_ZIZPA|nr:hypothetical protein GUJ93_ZPchr0007g3551 [Zizania palustris]
MPTLTPAGYLLLLLLLFLAATSSNCSSQGGEGEEEAGEQGARMVPMGPEAGGFSAMVLNETRRRLGSFQLCAPCTCCGGSRGACVLSPCCYAINCNIPNRPFGFCSFTPKSCDCLGCNL